MEFFNHAKAVRLRSHHEKYLFAEEDEETVAQNRLGSAKPAHWTVEPVPNHDGVIRLKSCYGKYLTASNHAFLLGMTGRKVAQATPKPLDSSSVEWEPVRDGDKVKLKTRHGRFLRANGGLPPWRNSVTHDVPHSSVTQEWVLWDVDVVEILVQSDRIPSPAPEVVHRTDSGSGYYSPADSFRSFKRQESNDSILRSQKSKSEGRLVYYHIADEDGEALDDAATEGFCMTFKGNSVEELSRQLEEETSIDGILLLTRSPLNRKLFPLRLQLPPNNAPLHVVVVPPWSNLAKEF